MFRVYIPENPTCEFITGVATNLFDGVGGFELTNSLDDADVIIASHFGDGAYSTPSIVKIFLDGESSSEYAGMRDKPLSASFDADIYVGPTANHALLEERGIFCQYIPFASLSFGQREKYTPSDLLNNKSKSECNQELFCAYLAYNPIPRRESFFDILQEKASLEGMRVDALGYCSGSSTKPIRTSTRFSSGWIDEAVELLQPYRFAIAFENETVKGYVTEKLINAYLAGCVPLYSGTEDAFEIFNKRSLIYIDDFDNMSSAASYILTVAKDQELYSSFCTESPLVEGALGNFFSWHKSIDGMLGQKLRELTQMRIENKKFDY